MFTLHNKSLYFLSHVMTKSLHKNFGIKSQLFVYIFEAELHKVLWKISCFEVENIQACFNWMWLLLYKSQNKKNPLLQKCKTNFWEIFCPNVEGLSWPRPLRLGLLEVHIYSIFLLTGRPMASSWRRLILRFLDGHLWVVNHRSLSAFFVKKHCRLLVSMNLFYH